MTTSSPETRAPIRPTRLLLTGRFARRVHEHLESWGTPIRLRHAAEPSAEDLSWADSVAGWPFPDPDGTGRYVWAHTMSAGLDAFAPYTDRFEVLTRTIGTMPEQMGRYAQAWVLNHCLHTAHYVRAQDRRTWEPRRTAPLPERAVVLGTGPIGAGVARALESLGIAVVGANRSGRDADGFSRTAPLRQIHPELERADVVVSALPGTEETAGILNDDLFSHLDEALLINVGRGVSLDEAGLRRALDAGRVTGAVLDVFETEPLDEDSWLWGEERIHITPHISAQTRPVDIAAALHEAVLAFERGEEPPTAVHLA
ncbi:NAD(P)-dependent oxidoreductase [Helcobacillus massiliensis]|uniref:Phosphoglycerate dehydrogenase-like enzyme n=1 Tax=Helcobacillus massiliensis TaxID=521392 RepID=A0A839QTS0_9MICO|nr:NAD(P)-dependent oxidoreductase [Helcobacillus massiliensis]MBB3023873.1 phosphoglycerate dehydrogenase-like enzyme [Helcobacillus massiliensis]